MADDDFYVHGTDESEQARLTALNDLMNEASLRELRLAPAERVLDVGSGLGQLTRAIARRTGARVVGIERSQQQIAEALRQARAAGEEALLDVRQGDAEKLPLEEAEWGSFDVAHARFLLEHVADPLAVTRAMVRAVHPGGRVVLEDDDHDLLRLWPEPAGVMAVWKAYIRSYDRAGRDPYVGRRLVQLLHQAGAVPRRNDWIFFGSCSGNAAFAGFVRNLASIFEGARVPIVETGVADDEISSAIAALESWQRRADAAFWFAISWAEAIRPPDRS